MINRLYNFLIKEIELRQKQREIFNKTQAGDMLWCSMPLPQKELKKIDASHRIRPYLVVKKEGKFLLCYQSSSKNRDNMNNYEKYCVKQGKYKNKSNSWIDLTDVKKIKVNNIQLEFITLNQIDIKKIEKKICIGQNRGNNKLIRFNEPIYIEEGDVVTKKDKTYYVYSEDSMNIHCFRIQKKRNKNRKLERIKINSKTYYTNFKELETIKRSEDINIIDIAYKEEILLILDQKKSLKAIAYATLEEKMQRAKNKFEIGAVFQYGSSTVMYLYSRANKHYGVDLLWYTIKTRVFEIKEIQRRKLLGVKDLEEIKNVLEFLIDKNVQNSDIRKTYQYVRNLFFSSVRQ